MAEQQPLVQATLAIPQESVDIVREMARKANVSMAEIVRRAIFTNKLLQDADEQGSLILLKDKNSSMRRVILQR